MSALPISMQWSPETPQGRAKAAGRLALWRLLCEFGLLATLQVVPTFFLRGVPFFPGESPFPWTILGWVVYLALNQRYFSAIPRPIILIACANLLGAAGYVASGMVVDLLFPINQGLACLALAGVFARRAANERNLSVIAAVTAVLIALATYASIARNNIEIFAEGGSRAGFSLIGWFAVIMLSATLALPGWFKVFSVAPILLILRSGSRSAMVAGGLQLAVMYLLTRQRTLNWRRLLVVGVVAVVLFAAVPEPATTIQTTLARSPEDWERLVDIRGARALVWQAWWDFFLEHPSLFGHGLVTYGWRLGFEMGPHNGILHFFNGYGIISGVLYLWGCFALFGALLRLRPPLPPVVIWSLGLVLAQFSHGFFEATTVAEGTVHVVGLFAAYGTGVGLQHARASARRGPAARVAWAGQRTRLLNLRGLRRASGSGASGGNEDGAATT